MKHIQIALFSYIKLLHNLSRNIVRTVSNSNIKIVE